MAQRILLFDGLGSLPCTTTSFTTVSLPTSSGQLRRLLFRSLLTEFAKLLDNLSTEQRAYSRLNIVRNTSGIVEDIANTDSSPNPLLELTSLFSLQVGRFVEWVANQPDPALGQADEVLGFSSGVFVALLSAMSSDALSVVCNSTTVFRLVFFIGLHTQRFREELFRHQAIPLHHPYRDEPWSAVLHVSTIGVVEGCLREFNQCFGPQDPKACVYITAVVSETIVTVSGFPATLKNFLSKYGPYFHNQKPARIYSLYHAKALQEVEDAVLKDFSACFLDGINDTANCSKRIHISYPLHRYVRSMSAGTVLSPPATLDSMASDIVKMVLTDPIRLDLVIAGIEDDHVESPVRFLNFGPGNQLAHAIGKSVNIRHQHTITSEPSTPRFVFEDFEGYLAEEPARGTDFVRSPSAPTPSVDQIAIVGMSVCLPGASNADQLWDVLMKGLNTVSEVPATRFNISSYNSSEGSAMGEKRSMNTRYGNFLSFEDAAGFDCSFFHISPREAKNMDPQIRILLRSAWNALESAGWVPRGGRPEVNASQCNSVEERVGCFVGAATNDYTMNLRHDIDIHYLTGTLSAFLSGRISHCLGLSGPSMVVNTACSSSLVALYQACRSIQRGDCDMAIAGGVNAITSPDLYLGLDKAHFLSPSGQCKPFSESADGYCRAEGCGMFVLKPLHAAEKDKDNILGVIRGVEVNQSSAISSITRPDRLAQERLFTDLLEHAGVEPDSISVIEAHGTGTQIGDSVELQSIGSVFCDAPFKRSVSDRPLHITSIKANIGHSEAASGAASLAKILLMFKHGVIPAQISVDCLNRTPEAIRVATLGGVIEAIPVQWDRGNTKRLAVVNNFGAAGSNAALLMEEPARADAPLVKARQDTPTIVAFSAESHGVLEILRERYLAFVKQQVDCGTFSLPDFAYTVTARRKIRPWRVSFVADSPKKVMDILKDPVMLPTSKGDHAAPGDIVFLFSGQGGQYNGMGHDLYQISTLFREKVTWCHKKLLDWGYPGVLSIVDPEKLRQKSWENQLADSQCSIFALQYGLLSLWTSWGIMPTVVGGHSIGEYAALVAASVLPPESALRLLAYRAHLITSRCARAVTGMICVRSSPVEVSAILEKLAQECPNVSIACENGPTNTVVGGPLDQLERIRMYISLRGLGHQANQVDVPYGYHTEAMDAVVEEFETYASCFDFDSPRIPTLSNLTGSVIMPGDRLSFNHTYLPQQCRQPVLFSRGINALMDLQQWAPPGKVTFVELGPHPVILPVLPSPTDVINSSSLYSLHRRMSARQTLFSSLSELYRMHGDGIIWESVFTELDLTAKCIDAPLYPLNESNYWIPYEEDLSLHHMRPPTDPFSLLGSWTCRPSALEKDTSVFENSLSQLADYVTGHNVFGFDLCPASVYLELALSAIKCTLESGNPVSDDNLITLKDVEFVNPLVYALPTSITVVTTVNLQSNLAEGTFNISTRGEGLTLRVHCTGSFKNKQSANLATKLTLGCPQALQSNMRRGARSMEILHTRTIYEQIFPPLVKYHKRYHLIETVNILETPLVARATTKASQDLGSGLFVVHPVYLDVIIHTVGLAINRLAQDDEAYICSEVKSFKMLYDRFDYREKHEVICSAQQHEGQYVADAWLVACAQAGQVLACAKGVRFSKVRVNSLRRTLAFCAGKPDERQRAPLPHKDDYPAQLTISNGAGSARVGAAMDHMRSAILKTLSDVTGLTLADVKLDSKICDFGLDSIMWIDFVAHMKEQFPALALPPTYPQAAMSLDDLVHLHLQAETISGPKTPMLRKGIRASEASHSSTTSASRPAPDFQGLLARVLDLPNALSPHSTFTDLGLDSLLVHEALHVLQPHFSERLSIDLFMEYPTVEKAVRFLQNLHRAGLPIAEGGGSQFLPSTHGEVAEKRILVNLQTSPERKQPLFLVHDGSGLSTMYSHLSLLDRDVWGLNNPCLFDDHWRDKSIRTMSHHYSSLIQPLVKQSGCILGGWSFGGVVAFQAACELQSSGAKVAGVILIDSPSPFTETTLPVELIDAVLEPERSARMDLIRLQMKLSSAALVAYDPLQDLPDLPTYPPIAMLRCIDAFPVSSLVGGAKIPFFEDRGSPRAIVEDWERLTGQSIPVLDIPGNHFSLFQPGNVSVLSRRLEEAISVIEERGRDRRLE